MLGVVASIASAGTWAYFDSSKPVAGNQIKAGNIDLEVSNQFFNYPPYIVPMEAKNVKPGEVDARLTPIPTYAINKGSIDGVLSAKIVPSAGDDGILSKSLVIKATTNPYGKTITLWDGTSTGSQEIGDLSPGPLNGATIYYMYSFPDNDQPQNELQGKTFKFDVEYFLKQK